MKSKKIIDRYMIVEGFRDVSISNVERFLELLKRESNACCIQVLNADLIAGYDHILFATLNALRGYRLGKAISNKLAIEILLYASGQHQISKAIEMLGIKSNSQRIILIVVCDYKEEATEIIEKIANVLKGSRSMEVIEINNEKMISIKEAFQISESELEAVKKVSEKESLSRIIIEHIALLATQV